MVKLYIKEGEKNRFVKKNSNNLTTVTRATKTVKERGRKRKAKRWSGLR